MENHEMTRVQEKIEHHKVQQLLRTQLVQHDNQSETYQGVYKATRASITNTRYSKKKL